MSTRAQIVVEGSDVYIYKHSDGYPEGVLPWLEPYVARFLAGRGHDPDYLTARIVAEGIRVDAETWAEYEKERAANGQVPTLGENFLGWGVDTDLHGDIEYLYVVERSGKIKIVKGRSLEALIKR